MAIPIHIKYKKHTASGNVMMDVFYRCSNCGKDVEAKHFVEASASEVTGVSNDGSSFANDLKKTASDNLQQKLNRILDEYKEGKYDTANFDIKCPHCGHKEIWSQLNMPTWGCVVHMLGGGCIFFGLLSFAKPMQAFILTGIGIGILALCSWIMSLIHKKKYEKIAMLPKVSLPEIHIVSNEERKRRVLSQYEPGTEAYNIIKAMQDKK